MGTLQLATVRHILHMYGVEATRLYPVQKGYRNQSYGAELADSRTVNVMLYKDEPDMLQTIRRINRLGAFLAEKNLPVRTPLSDRIVTLSKRNAVRYGCLYNYLPGETIPWEAYTQKHIKLLGQTLGQLHTALTTYSDPHLPRVSDEYSAIIGRMERYFSDKPARQAAAAKLGLQVPKKVFTRYLYILRFCEKLYHQQALHMDFVRSNILFSNTPNLHISGIIDFEKAAYGHPLFDVARTLAFLLVDCKYKPNDKVRKYFLDSGYQKRGGRRLDHVYVIANGRRTSLLEELVNLFLLYDFYKFLRHNPYESLRQNEHYTRTRDLLLARGVITTTITGSK